MTKKLTERDEAVLLANRILEDSSRDPDGDRSVLARQFLRGQEIIDNLKVDLGATLDPTGNLVQANRDQMLKMHEEAVRRIIKIITKYVERDETKPTESGDHKVTLLFGAIEAMDCKMLWKILQRLSTFHPMNDTWLGWPEGSE